MLSQVLKHFNLVPLEVAKLASLDDRTTYLMEEE